MEAVTTQVGMSMADFIRQYNDQPFEILHGEVKTRMPNVSRHQETNRTLYRALDRHTQEKQLGEVMFETPFVVSFTSNWVTGSRVPDIMYYTQERITAYRQADPDYGDKPYVLVPDLVIEIVSPTDNLVELSEKVDLYLADGVRLVVVVDPQRRRVTVSRLISQQPFTEQTVHLKEGDILTCGEVIPGFELPLSQLFE